MKFKKYMTGTLRKLFSWFYFIRGFLRSIRPAQIQKKGDVDGPKESLIWLLNTLLSTPKHALASRALLNRCWSVDGIVGAMAYSVNNANKTDVPSNQIIPTKPGMPKVRPASRNTL